MHRGPTTSRRAGRVTRLLVRRPVWLLVLLLSVTGSPARVAADNVREPGTFDPAPNPTARWWASSSAGPSITGASSVASYGLLFGGCARYSSSPNAPVMSCPSSATALNADGRPSILGDTWIWTGGSWLKVPDGATRPPPRWGAHMAYDKTSNKTLLFGGCCTVDATIPPGATHFADTWVFDWNTCLRHATAPGVIRPETCRWQQVVSAAAPPGRALGGMASDGAGGAILYGGYKGNRPDTVLLSPDLVTCGMVLADTWRFDFPTSTWTQRATANSCTAGGETGKPLPVYAFHMASTKGTMGSVVLYGGALAEGVSPLEDGAAMLNSETWIWNGTTWTPYNESTRIHYPGRCFGNQHVMCSEPGARYGGFMAVNDSDDGYPILFAGCSGGKAPPGDGGCGTQHSTQCGATTFYQCTWTWRGSGWTSAASTITPWIRMGAAGIGGKAPAVFGGNDGERLLNDTYVYNITRGTWVAAGDWSPSWTSTSTLQSAGFPTKDGVTTNARAWMNAGPAPRWGAAMVDDGSRIVLFGGRVEKKIGDLDDTWVRVNGAWVNMSQGTVALPGGTGTSPSPRAAASMVSIGGGKVVLFGGAVRRDNTQCYQQGFCETYYNDTWLWDGTVWRPVSTTGPSGGTSQACAPAGAAPAGRKNAAIAYDSVAQRIVVYGGEATHPYPYQPNGIPDFCDTWVLQLTSTGTAPAGVWTRACGSPSYACAPGSRTGASMAYHPEAGVTLLHGGFDNWEFWADTWIGYFGSDGKFHWKYEPLCYDGQAPYEDELPRCFATDELISYSSPLVYDPVTQDLVSFGGYTRGTQTCTRRNFECTLRELHHSRLSVVSGLAQGSTTLVLGAAPPASFGAGDALVLTGGVPEPTRVLTYEAVTRTVTLAEPVAYVGHTGAGWFEWENATPPPIRPCGECSTYTDTGDPVWWPPPGIEYSAAYDRTAGSIVVFGGRGETCSSLSCAWNEMLGTTWVLPRD